MNIKKINANNQEYDIGVDWENIDNKPIATSTSDGLMSASDKQILSQFEQALKDNIKIELNEPYLFEKGSVQNITISWVITNNGEALIPDQLYLNNVQLLPTTNNKTFNNVNVDTVYTLKILRNGISTEASTQALFRDPIYYGGISPSIEVTSEQISSLNKVLVDIHKEVNINIGLSNQLVCIACPQSFGELNTITDINFDYINSFNKSELSVNGVQYFVYVLKDPVTYQNLKLYFL